MTMMERLYRVACAELGYDFDSLYETKQEWIADRGARHDINTPRKPDVRDAVRAILNALRDPDEGALEAMEIAISDAPYEGPGFAAEARDGWQAGLDHILHGSAPEKDPS